MNVDQLVIQPSLLEVLERIELFVGAVQAVVTGNFETNFKNLTPDVISCDTSASKKYARIVKSDAPVNGGQPSSRSVWGFVDLSNGDILKAAGWKAPAKHARGNIFDADFSVKNWSAYGPRYL